MGPRGQPDARPARDRVAAALTALTDARTEARSARFPLAAANAASARAAASGLVGRLDDYVVPKLGWIEAPLLAVVGGSTGAGKSTLTNSLVAAPISPTGVLRPTTRNPLLLCNPVDMVWFGRADLLPQLARSARPGERRLQIVSAPLLRPGLALLDAPDLDSVVDANRVLAHELLTAADLWLFVTTAARYADAVPWRVLRSADQRGITTAVVLDRVPPEDDGDIPAHLARLLASQGLGDLPLFVIRESDMDGHGLLPEPEVAPIRQWLNGVAGDASRRNRIAIATLDGAIGRVEEDVEGLAKAAETQVTTISHLAGAVRSAFATAMSDVEYSLRGGAMLRGEVHAQWQRMLDTDAVPAALRTTEGRSRRLGARARIRTRPAPGLEFQAAVSHALAGLITEVDAFATQQVREQWRAEPAGRALLAADPALGRPWTGFVDAAHDLVHDWHSWLRTVVRSEAYRVRTPDRGLASASSVLLAVIAAVAPPVEEVTGAGPDAVRLRAVLEHPPARELGDRARADLLVRVGELLSAEVYRHLDPLTRADVDPAQPQRLRDVGTRVATARAAWLNQPVDGQAPRSPDTSIPPRSAGDVPSTSTGDVRSDSTTDGRSTTGVRPGDAA